MPGESLGQQGQATHSVTAGRDAYNAGRDIAITNYTVTSNVDPAAADADGAFRVRVDRALEELADAVGEQWRAEERLRRIHDPVPLPVRWTAADPLLSDHPANIHRVPGGAIDLDGGLYRVAEAFGGAARRRLPGAARHRPSQANYRERAHPAAADPPGARWPR